MTTDAAQPEHHRRGEPSRGLRHNGADRLKHCNSWYLTADDTIDLRPIDRATMIRMLDHQGAVASTFGDAVTLVNLRPNRRTAGPT